MSAVGVMEIDSMRELFLDFVVLDVIKVNLFF
jgi:hypothetical protein